MDDNTDLHRSLVEAAGVEPASEKVYREKTTCVSDSLFFVRPMRNRQEGGGLARLVSAFGYEQKPWTQSCKMTPLNRVQALRLRTAT